MLPTTRSTLRLRLLNEHAKFRVRAAIRRSGPDHETHAATLAIVEADEDAGYVLETIRVAFPDLVDEAERHARAATESLFAMEVRR